jgi:hypothetical protein
MTIKPVRPDLELLRYSIQFAEETGNYVDINPSCILWLIDTLEGAERLIEPDATYLDDWQGDADEWLAKYRGEE